MEKGFTTRSKNNPSFYNVFIIITSTPDSAILNHRTKIDYFFDSLIPIPYKNVYVSIIQSLSLKFNSKQTTVSGNLSILFYFCFVLFFICMSKIPSSLLSHRIDTCDDRLQVSCSVKIDSTQILLLIRNLSGTLLFCKP